MYNNDLNGYFRLSMQSALLGSITPNIRAVIGFFYDKKIVIDFYFDGVISEDDEELASEVGTEVIADFESEFDIEIKTIRLDYPKPVKNKDGFLLFLRKE
ncbi:hypothetical protein KWG64_10650 [Rahnella sp. PD12R]|uniref:hypothetical protein n=1 Tax=Rahnella sp. PD12R TaxID=2855688 RepID=UPI001C453B63|nr:hypothetical protein [Rahnella sp. PD12R]MBV6818400.1 hypothetical protein [Rahnella sp. PD12R]